MLTLSTMVKFNSGKPQDWLDLYEVVSVDAIRTQNGHVTYKVVQVCN